MTNRDDSLIQAASIARDDAMARVAGAASPEFIDFAKSRIIQHLLDNPTFHCNDFWANYPDDAPETRQARALGPVINAVKRDGYMSHSGHFGGSAKSHLSSQPVWFSNIYQPIGQQELL